MLAVLALAVLAATPSGAATNATKAKDAAPSCVVRLTDDGPASPALNCLYLLFDPERELDFDAARSARNQARYELNTKTTPNFGYAAARLWTRLEAPMAPEPCAICREAFWTHNPEAAICTVCRVLSGL